MPDRTYGTPIGATGGKPITKGRTKPVPGSAKSYLEHMAEADKAFHEEKQRASGNSGGLSGVLAKGKPPVGIGGRRREQTIMDAVDKASR